MNTEQEVLNAFERGKAFGFAEGMKSMRCNMNNEPVAWISRLPEGDVYNCAWAEKQNDDDIPLYTHPVKELTDKEIMECKYLVEAMYGSLPPLEFAWAILRKAQEK